jgi:NAD(P)-dependent dehydrogenase (short-subunit alcohol dehydrogenase family)
MPVALITGGAGAVGAATARMLARDGFSLVLADLDGDRTEAIAEDIRRDGAAEVVALRIDIAAPDAAAGLMALVSERFGRLDCLVNNAGRTGASKIDALDPAEWDAVLRINLTAPMLLCREAVPLMRATGGSIVNVASRVYLSGTGVGYTSSKSGLIGLTRALAVQLGPHNIRVNAVAPSFLNSPFNKKIVAENSGLAEAFRKITPLGRVGTPEDVAGAIAFLASDRASFITGDVLHVCGGAQLAPQPA